MRNTKIDGSHISIVVVMGLLIVVFFFFGKSTGYNYGWYYSKSHWQKMLLLELESATTKGNFQWPDKGNVVIEGVPGRFTIIYDK